MKRFPTLQFFFLVLCFSFLFLTEGHTQDFVYSPVNSAFGGNALNYNWMLSSANSQNNFSDPSATDFRNRDQLADFTNSLERQLLSQISSEIFRSQIGSDGLEEGTFQFGNLQVDVSNGLDGIIITIQDYDTGGSTQITVPFF